MSFISSLPSLTSGALAALAPRMTASVASSPSQSSAAARDTAVADLPAVSNSVNLLAQAATASSTTSSSGASSSGEQLTLPPLPQMPAPQAPPAVPTDDHGTSNVVFSDPDADGSLIH